MLRHALFAALLPLAAAAAPEIPLAHGPHRDLALQALPDSTLEIRLGGGHPHFWTAVVPAGYDPARQSILALDYFAPSGLESVVLRYRAQGGDMVVAEARQTGIAEAWQPLVFDLSRLDPPPAAGHPEMRFHFALNGAAESLLRLRHLRLRAPTAAEARLAAERDQTLAAREADAAAILADLRAERPARIETVHVGARVITLAGSAPAPARLVPIPPETPSHQAGAGVVEVEVQPGPGGRFRVEVPRLSAGSPRDRAVWRWRLADADGRWLSAAAWPGVIGPAVARALPRLEAPHQKGIGVPPLSDAGHEIFDLGIRHATVNIVVSSLLRAAPAPGWEPWEFEGRVYYKNERALLGHDTTLRLLAEKQVIASAILLVSNGRAADGAPRSPMVHTEAEPRGIYSIPNLSAETPARLYRAVLHLMAERWSREDGAHGRVTNWILHNEVDQAATWTNMGAQPLARYLETLMRSARLTHHTARLFDPHARVFISLTHHWTRKSGGAGTYIVRDMLEMFAEMARAEGDFEWGVAYHPYPQDLRNPDAWKDDGLTNDFDTPLITPRNIAVLPAFLDQPRFHFQGAPRGILLSEQGFNTPTLSEADQRRQVAGLIYMFRQIRPLKAVEAFHLHRYHDMPEQEGGLRLGIITETGARKLGWEAYKAIGTEREVEFGKLADEVMDAP